MMEETEQNTKTELQLKPVPVYVCCNSTIQLLFDRLLKWLSLRLQRDAVSVYAESSELRGLGCGERFFFFSRFLQVHCSILHILKHSLQVNRK